MLIYAWAFVVAKTFVFFKSKRLRKKMKKNWEKVCFFDENLQHSLNGVRAKDEKFETLQLNLVEII
jgi:hypothetical protein